MKTSRFKKGNKPKDFINNDNYKEQKNFLIQKFLIEIPYSKKSKPFWSLC